MRVSGCGTVHRVHSFSSGARSCTISMRGSARDRMRAHRRNACAHARRSSCCAGGALHRRLDGGKHLTSLNTSADRRSVRRRRSSAWSARNTALQPPHFLFQQDLALDRLLMFTLELRVGEFDLLEPFVLFAQQSVLFFGNFQADRELGVLIRKAAEFVRREHQRSVPRRTKYQ